MARNVKYSGFSLVEILIAMVVLSVAVLSTTVFLTASSKQHSSSNSSDAAYAIANEKLTELQMTGITTSSTGEEIRMRGDAKYGVSWITTIHEVPNKVDITVTWPNGRISISGFIKANVCTAVPGNHAPSNITLSNASVEANLPAGTLVGKISTIDVDTGLGDAFRYSLVNGVGATHNQYFIIYAGVLKTVMPLTAQTYSVRIKTMDCANSSFEKSFTVTATTGIELKVANQNCILNEHYSSTVPFDTVMATPSDVSFSIINQTKSGMFTIDALNGFLRVTDSVNLDFETNPSLFIQVQVMKNKKISDAVIAVSLNNVNDIPTLKTAAAPSILDSSRIGINEPRGVCVNAFVDSLMNDKDVSAIKGIAIYEASNQGNGTWQYNVGGDGWVVVPPVSAISALLLRSADSIRYSGPKSIPITDDKPRISFRGWDQSSRSAGDFTNVSVQGLTSPFSKGTSTSLMNVMLCSKRPAIQEVAFTTGIDGYTFFKDSFNTANPDYAAGAWNSANKYLRMRLGGYSTTAINNGMSGAFRKVFSLDTTSTVNIRLDYSMTMTASYPSSAVSQVLLEIDTTKYGLNGKFFLDSLTPGNSITPKTVIITTGVLPVGNHSILIGGYNNKKGTLKADSTVITIDNITICR
ncbi:MAG: prepilin-type N-terminal cleavage/methylation domain-containing protein [Chitinivibrionales bacterium]|nr:prepilin-type N-terminal cleavage/methylation domain-containing protein [Chitinivibrionales bacterium]